LRERMHCPAEEVPSQPSSLKALVTTRWLAWDWVFGVFIPPVILILDPCVFRSGGGRALFPEYRVGAYVFILQNAALLAAWLGARPSRGLLLVSGMLFGSGG